MAVNKGNGRLTNRQYVQLSEAISGPNMESIAQGYMDIDVEVISSIRCQCMGNAALSNKAMIQRWANQPKNSDKNQTKNLASILYKAASEGAYCNPHKVKDILGFTEEEARAETNPAPVPDVVPQAPPSHGAGL